MAQLYQLNNVTTPDRYDDVAAIDGAGAEFVAVRLQITGAAVFYEVLRIGGGWESEEFSAPIVGVLGLELAGGMHFRSAVPGQPAQVTARMLTAAEVAAGVGNISAPAYTVGAAGNVVPIQPQPSAVGLFVGQIIEMAGGNPDPTRTLACDGSQLLKSDPTYAQLNTYLAAAGYPYGSDATHFNLPDKRERVAIGAGPNSPLGASDGVAVANRHGPQHRHTMSGQPGILDPFHAHDHQGNVGVGAGDRNALAEIDSTGSVRSSAGIYSGPTGVTASLGTLFTGARGTDPLDAPAYVATSFFIVFKAT